jgi:hypothetical protein
LEEGRVAGGSSALLVAEWRREEVNVTGRAPEEEETLMAERPALGRTAGAGQNAESSTADVIMENAPRFCGWVLGRMLKATLEL